MIYREYLVMRKALAWFAGILLAVTLFGSISRTIVMSGGNLAGAAAASGWLAAVFASIFGVALGNGSRDAARVLWLLPVPRWRAALDVIAVDLAGTTAAFACAYALNIVAAVLAGAHVTAAMLQTANVSGVVMALSMAYAAYGWSALAGMIGRRVAYCGIVALPALMLWMMTAQSWVTKGAVPRALVIANPFIVFNAGLTLNSRQDHGFALDPVVSSLQWLGTGWETPVLLATAIATCGLAAVLWQRAEAIR